MTLFEGEPYTLWNIKDLARHAGLKVLKSFRFEWEDYPGYSHVRTLGKLVGNGGWKGEERLARTYVFERPRVAGEVEDKKRKRKGEDSESDSEDD